MRSRDGHRFAVLQQKEPTLEPGIVHIRNHLEPPAAGQIAPVPIQEPPELPVRN